MDTGLVELDAPLRDYVERVHWQDLMNTATPAEFIADGGALRGKRESSDWRVPAEVEDAIGVLATATRGQDQANWAVQPVPFLVSDGTISPCLDILTPARPRDVLCRSYRQRTREPWMSVLPSLLGMDCCIEDSAGSASHSSSGLPSGRSGAS